MIWRNKVYTMLYDAETLKPELLVEEDIRNGEVGKIFWVINGEWGGTFNEDSVTINRWGKKRHSQQFTNVISLHRHHLKNTYLKKTLD